MRLIIASPDSALLDVSEVDWVNIRLADGSPISIYTNHAPLVALHAECSLKYRLNGQVFEQPITQGVLSITHNTVKCLVQGNPVKPADKINQKEKNKE